VRPGPPAAAPGSLALSTPAPTPAPGGELVPDGEAEAIEAVLRANLALLDTDRTPVPRGQHPKTHGCVQAELRVGTDVPQALRHGLFAAPGVYRALVRFSNGGRQDDRQGDAHGMAVKVFGPAAPQAGLAEFTEQDFLMVDSPVFFLRNAADYAVFSRAFQRAKRSRLAKALSFLPKVPGLIALAILWFGFFRGHREEFRVFRSFVGHRPDDLLALRYWSATPYRLGPHAVRFSARPTPGQAIAAAPPPDSADRLRQALKTHLDAHEARFEFLVQRQTDPVAMPVEDPTVAWDEARSPYVRVAELRIPAQSFDDEHTMRDCEQRAFSPWHTLPEHRPLGGINRVRKRVYETMYRSRGRTNSCH